MLDRLYRSILSTSSTLIFLLLAIGLIGLSGLDIALRIYPHRLLLIGVGSGLCMLLVASVLILSSRKLSIRSALGDIPKLYVPIHPGDLPKRVHRLIQADLSKSASIASEAQPLPSDLLGRGWGSPNTPQQSLPLRPTLLSTFSLLQQAFAPYFQRPPTYSPRRYVDHLIQMGYIQRDVGRRYIDTYERVRFGNLPVYEEEYTRFMAVFAKVLDSQLQAAA
ncbi:hypothetical protein BC832DRAFT_565960 [Gaertneriomyces semiglobifer]|nr:hypothetical protein BC832DRAFT_565960 [Gaertneriomyces semiglobifer]